MLAKFPQSFKTFRLQHSNTCGYLSLRSKNNSKCCSVSPNHNVIQVNVDTSLIVASRRLISVSNTCHGKGVVLREKFCCATRRYRAVKFREAFVAAVVEVVYFINCLASSGVSRKYETHFWLSLDVHYSPSPSRHPPTDHSLNDLFKSYTANSFIAPLLAKLGLRGLKVTCESPPTTSRRTACKDRIAQRSPTQAAVTFDINSWFFATFNT
ncbi:hypothetical protein J6590_041511 [Homalodisca vitripennis]|nr:hypothetical protein J6590_041511 [Homalodisca vitripennis]